MIVVIADDLTGAAELGGLGLRYGLTVEMVTTVDQPSNADLLVVATDTRSMPEPEALKVMAYITLKLKRFKLDLIFKKVDSVLRGHVISELNTHLHQLGLERAILVPANPALGRTITGGHYFVHGEPIHQTSFVNDPDFAAKSSDVIELLRVADSDVHLLTPDKPLPTDGIIVGECGYADDLLLWADKADSNTLMAGGSGFFSAILGSLNLKPLVTPGTNDVNLGSPSLFVCGSTFNNSKKLVETVSKNGGPVSYMPLAIVNDENPADELFEQWANDIAALLKANQKAIVAVAEETTNTTENTPVNLRQKKAKVVELVFKKTAVKELLIEGGATAAAVINQLGIHRFFPVREYETGVIRMKIDKHEGVFLTMKPGSYEWPSPIWNF